MKKKATDSDALVPAVLTLPDNEVCHIHLPAGFISPVKNAAKKIVKAYDKVRNQPDVLSADQTPAQNVNRVAARLFKLMPDVDGDDRFGVLNLFVMQWVAQALGDQPGFTFPQSPGESAPSPETTAAYQAGVAKFLGVPPGQLRKSIAHAVGWIIVSEYLKSHKLPKTAIGHKSSKKEPTPSRTKLSIPNAFPDGVALVPNNPVIAAGIRAIFKGGEKARQLLGGWTQEGKQVQYRQVHRSGRGEIRYYPDIHMPGRKRAVDTDTLWCFVESLNPFTADVALAILAQLCEPTTGNRPKFPLRQSVLINADAILRYKGIQKYGKDRRVMERRIHDEVERLRTLYFDLDRYPLPWEKRGSRYQGDRLFDIVKMETYQLKLFDEEEVIATAWSIRAGQWAEHFFNTEQERVWTSRMAKALIEMDHRNQRKTAQLAKKIGYLLLTVPGGTAHRNRPVTRRIDRILEEIGELPSPEFMPKDWAGRLRDNLLKAWDILLAAGLIKDLRFPNGFGFADTDRTKGWVKDWLASKVIITTPEAFPEPSERELMTLRKRQRLKNNSSRRRVSQRIHKKPHNMQLKICTPEYRKKVRDACESRYLTQRNLAKMLGIAPSTLSNILRGHNLPSEKVAHQIDAWLETADYG
jgi:DNA-binding XRE family transcriptional regulator